MAEYKIQNYERIGILPLEVVFPYIEKYYEEPRREKAQIGEFFVNVSSLRLKTFFKCGPECACCAIKASFFAVERSPGVNGYHLNLYGLNQEGKEILFTHDHILARGAGGQDHISNTETMCGPCNWEKGALEQKMIQAPTLEEREFFEHAVLNFKTNKQNRKKAKP